MKKKIIALVFVLDLVLLNAQENRYTDFSLKSLQNYPYKSSPITVQNVAVKDKNQIGYNVNYTSMGGLTVSARLRLPPIKPEDIKGIIVMLRGHQNPNRYSQGSGTENPARGYLERGWAVIAPDFLGYGYSSPVPPPGNLHQFYSTINTVELYKSLEQADFRFAPDISQSDRAAIPGSFKKIVLWGHSNGGQVALHFLEIIQKPVPTVLWAPVAIAYPDNISHYSRNSQWAETFKKNYSAADFSLIAYLDKIAPGTPILISQGDKDKSVPREWSDALVKEIALENSRRQKSGKGDIEAYYEIYLTDDHSLTKDWNTILPGDIAFYEKY
jgi:pimeloyl-ACP methyl ester carboxylesterase